MGVPTRPCILVAPYLPLREPVEFADWWLGPLERFGGSWLSDVFEQMARAFIGGFRKVNGEPVTNPALLVRRADGADGTPPSADEFDALRLALDFATIDQNPYWTPEGRDNGWTVATVDNAELWVQPIDLDGGHVSLSHGFRVNILTGGPCVLDKDFVVPPPLEMFIPFGVDLDAEVLAAVYAVALEAQSARQLRLRNAIRWIAKAWANSPSVSWEDRLVFVKVAGDSLSGESASHIAGQLFVWLFACAALQEGDGVGLDDLLWRQDEPRYSRIWRGGASEVSAFEHWYSALGDARNDLVHEGDVSSLDYAMAGSQYNGPIVEIGDRVLREAIKVELGELGYPEVWRRRGTLARAGFYARRRLRSLAPDPDVT